MRPHTSYLICATQRSGSTLLSEALAQTALAGQPKEYFEALKDTGLPRRPLEYFAGISDQSLLSILRKQNYQDEQPQPGILARNFETYLAQVLEQGTSPNGVFGAKMMWNYFADFLAQVRTIPRYRILPVPSLLSTLFPDLHYIFIQRRDKVAQAVSLWKALQTGAWRQDDGHAVENTEAQADDLQFHFGAIDYLLNQFEDEEQSWHDFFSTHCIVPFMVTFEDLTAAYEKTILAILEYLNVELPPDFSIVRPRMQRQADAISASWIEQYQALKQI